MTPPLAGSHAPGIPYGDGRSFGQYNRRMPASPCSFSPPSSPPRPRARRMRYGSSSRPRTLGREPHGPMLERILPPTFELHQLPSAAPAARVSSYGTAFSATTFQSGNASRGEWPAIFERMVVRMRGRGNLGELMQDMMAGVEAPSVDEAETLLAYLRKHSQRPLDAKKYPAVNLPEGQSFKLACQQCHVLPDPQRHKASECLQWWRAWRRTWSG